MPIEVRQPPADFLRQVDAETIRPDQIAVWHIGGAGYVVRTPSETIYIDPFCGPSIDETWVRGLAAPFDPSQVSRCDAILSTHEHVDHCDPVALKPMLSSTSAPFIGPASSIDTARGFGWPDARLRAMAPGESTTLGNTRITAVRSNDPMAIGCIGFVLEAAGLTFVNMGDSLWYDDIGKELGGWDVDVICLSVAQNPVGQTLYMSEVDAVRIARDVGAKVLVPHHWDLWQWVALDPRRVAAVAPWYAPETQIRPARYCERMTFARCGSGVLVS